MYFITKRTPKNYNGIHPTGKKAHEVLPVILNNLSKKCSDQPHLILAAWSDIAGKRVGGMSRAIAFESGILKVLVKNSTLHSLLVEHEKQKILQAFKKKFPKIIFQDILFKVG